MPITQPDLWIRPPFAGDLVAQPPYKKVLIGRGAVNSKGPQMAQWNALMSIKAVTGKLPVNLIIVAEGDEERMDMGYRTFVKAHPELFKGAEAMYRFGGQEIGGGSEGCLFLELTTSGTAWGRGPTYSDIHGANKRSVDLAGLASHQDAVLAGERERQQGPDPGFLRQHRGSNRCGAGQVG